ncbi:MAG: hypothetical protein VB858_11290 [Planctomycetaceae bacterium]
MSVRLCHACSQWVWTKNERCPGCANTVYEHLDPVVYASQIRPAIGDVLGKIGFVKIRHQHLPTDGTLYETQNGLFFLPHRGVQVTRFVEEHSSNPVATVAAILFAPLIFLLPFLRKRQLRETTVEKIEPVRLRGDDIQLLPELLPRMPGAFFVGLPDIQQIQFKKRRWTICRFSSADIVLEPISTEAFEARMKSILDSDSWQSVTGWS